MLDNAETAKYVSDLFFEVNERLSESIERVEETCAPDEFLDYRRRVGTLVYEVYEKILVPIYIRHPKLKPPNLEL
jgi:hypothetical protein